jgi:hypothetical protein
MEEVGSIWETFMNIKTGQGDFSSSGNPHSADSVAKRLLF